MATTAAKSTARTAKPTVKRLHPDLTLVDVTPELASSWLSKNTHNRPIRQPVVLAYARDMVDGNWLYNGDPIRFNDQGALMDGQHRLAAVVRSEVTVPMVVIRGLAAEVQDTVDSGVKRRFSDILALRGEANPLVLAAIVRLVHVHEHPEHTSSSLRSLTNAQLSETLEAHREELEQATIAGVHYQAGPLPPSIVGFAWYLFSALDHQDATVFFDRFNAETDHHEGDPIWELRKVVTRTDGSKHGGTLKRYLCAITIKAWNAWRNGEQVQVLRWRPGGSKPEAFPTPV